ncbi:unnamed protein product [Linum tenue]|uniref:Uncharacterized protein n=1 Tax=Linum tenue TaxID=586396 RepID=A0AAV0JMI7_9ROSI|nr:unnamed protein product [Linum tenue]
MCNSSFPIGRLAIADLGCASGPNSFFLVSEVIKAAHKLSRELGHESTDQFQIFLNDLPGNDFNNIFRSIQGFKEKIMEVLMFIIGVPGSFYDRLFQTDSLHFIHSSYGVHWSSQVPRGLEENKGNIYMAKTSPQCVMEAYYKQFQTDFSSFLKHRAQELVTGGRMVLTFFGRRSAEPCAKECCYIWELMSMALNQMASEGLIDQDKLDSFNLPLFTPSAMEVETEIQKQGSFAVEHLELWDMSWNAYEGEVDLPEALRDGGYNVSRCMKALFEPIIAHRLNPPREVINEVFKRCGLLLSDWMANERAVLVSLTVSLTKRG